MQVLQTCALATSPPVLNREGWFQSATIARCLSCSASNAASPIIPRNVHNESMANDPFPARASSHDELDYFLVDVFTSSALAGNPLAVVMNTAQLTAEQMLSIAREFNLSETTFV